MLETLGMPNSGLGWGWGWSQEVDLPLPTWRYDPQEVDLPQQLILKDKFLSQCASDSRIKLQQLQQQNPVASLDEMFQAATNTFYNREH